MHNIQKPNQKSITTKKLKTSKRQQNKKPTTTVINNNSERDCGPYYHKTSTRGDRTGPGRALRSVPATDTNNTSQLYDVFALVYTIDGMSNTDTSRKRNSNNEKDRDRFMGCTLVNYRSNYKPRRLYMLRRYAANHFRVSVCRSDAGYTDRFDADTRIAFTQQLCSSFIIDQDILT